MKWLINLFGKLAGAGKLLDKLNGVKSYIGGGALMLSGAAQVLEGLAKVNDLATLLGWIKHLPADQGVMAFAAGLAAVGLRHSVAKAADQPAQP